MENEDIEKNIDQTKEPPTLWKWYFGWHPRIFLTVPIFLLFVLQGLWFIRAIFGDVVFFFQHTEITWGSIFLVFIVGGFLITFIIAPIYLCFYSIGWLYEVNIGNDSAWKKFLYSIGLILLVVFGTSLIRLFNAWVIGIVRIF